MIGSLHQLVYSRTEISMIAFFFYYYLVFLYEMTAPSFRLTLINFETLNKMDLKSNGLWEILCSQ